jgi:hypothetical protein
MLPALLLGMQDQVPVLLPALKVVLAGTVSVMVTPVAVWVPMFGRSGHRPGWSPGWW